MSSAPAPIKVQDGSTAVAWRLLAPSVSGGKVYTIAVVGNIIITAWGRADAIGSYGAGTNATATAYHTHAAALVVAQERTSEKEARGYNLDLAPVQHTFRDWETQTTWKPVNLAGRVLENGKPV